MTRHLVLTLVLSMSAAITAPAQEVSTEYRVKAAFLYNFIKYVEWPAEVAAGPLTVCVAGRNPFGTLLAELVRGEVVAGRPVRTRVIVEPDPECSAIYMPRGGNIPAYLRAARDTPTLLLGETDDFIGRGGHVRFFLEDGYVRFEINPTAVERTGLRISSRVLKLARLVDDQGRPR